MIELRGFSLRYPKFREYYRVFDYADLKNDDYF